VTPASYDRMPTAADLLQQIGYLVVVGVVMQNGDNRVIRNWLLILNTQGGMQTLNMVVLFVGLRDFTDLHFQPA